MDMHSRSGLVCAVILVWGGSSAAQAVDKLTKEGTAIYVTHYSRHTLAEMDMGDIGRGSVAELVGSTRTVGGGAAFDNMSVRCMVYYQRVGDKYTDPGSCTETDADGDKVFTTFDEGTHYIVGGTGKYAGITGTAPYTAKGLKSPGTGLGVFTVEHKLSWKFK